MACKGEIWREELWTKYTALAENLNPEGLAPSHAEALQALMVNETPPMLVVLASKPLVRIVGLAFVLGYVLSLDTMRPSEPCDCEKSD